MNPPEFTNELSFIISNSSRYYMLICCKENVCWDLLPSNDSFVAIRCSGKVITEPLLSNGRPVRLHYFGFQPSCRSISERNEGPQNRTERSAL
jgi:hypothetical protein